MNLQTLPEAMTEKKLWTMMMTRKNTFSSNVALDDVTVFEAVESDAIALLADTWNDDLDPEVSAQLIQSSAQASFSVQKEKGKGKGIQSSAQAYFSFGKDKGNGKRKAKG